MIIPELKRDKLLLAEAEFLQQYPRGFASPEMLAVGKKHNVPKMISLSQEVFAKKAFKDIDTLAENMIKVVSRSSMVSMFEKPKFRDFVRRLQKDEKSYLVNALKDILHGQQERGFEAMVGILLTEKLAKWSLVSIIPAYYHPDQEVFVKPTTAKGVIKHFEVQELVYKPLPSWDFYQRYRAMILQAKTQVDESLSPSSAAFSGFLMMTMNKAEARK